jgi:hypothetical protein
MSQQTRWTDELSDATTTGFVLWHRERRGRPWQMIGTFGSEREAWRRVSDDGRRGGDYTVLPAGAEP